MKHSCNASETDMEYTIRSTGDSGEVARQALMDFITNKQDDHWEYVTVDEYEEGQRAAATVRSLVVRTTQPAVVPGPRENENLPPISMEADEDISLEEPPRKVVKRTETYSRSSVLGDLELSPTLSTTSSTSSSSSSSSDSSDSESETEDESEEESPIIVNTKGEERKKDRKRVENEKMAKKKRRAKPML